MKEKIINFFILKIPRISGVRMLMIALYGNVQQVRYVQYRSEYTSF